MLLSKRLIPEGLSDYVKATPPSVQHSHKHQLLHYPRSADAFGSLSGSWMFTDERRNKVIPNPNTHARTHTHTPPSLLTGGQGHVQQSEILRTVYRQGVF